MDRTVYVKGSQERQIGIGQLLRGVHYKSSGKMLMAEYFYEPMNEMLNKKFKGNLSMTYTFGTME
jgi:xanthine dehydrogenase molybdenum-binding subunit